MIHQFLSASFNLSMLPARLAIRNTKASFQAMRDLPGTVKQYAGGLHQSCGDSQLFIDQLMQRIDTELGGDPANLSNHEREMITAREGLADNTRYALSILNTAWPRCCSAMASSRAVIISRS